MLQAVQTRYQLQLHFFMRLNYLLKLAFARLKPETATVSLQTKHLTIIKIVVGCKSHTIPLRRLTKPPLHQFQMKADEL